MRRNTLELGSVVEAVVFDNYIPSFLQIRKLNGTNLGYFVTISLPNYVRSIH